MKKVLSISILSIFTLNYALGSSRSLPGIDLITRDERGADEAVRYESQPRYQSILQYRKEEAAKMEKLKETDIEAYLQAQESSYKNKLANEYLKTEFNGEYKIDESRYYYDGNKLWTPEYIKDKKNKFIIHHTAADYAPIMSGGIEAAMKYMQDVYIFHAYKRGWGDIGYNFVIDPFGGIYEGRAGGEGAIGMHVSRNNTPSLGISLMGNFDIQDPTKEQLSSLVKLLTVLAKKYKIDPKRTTVYHRKSNEAPYLETNDNYTIAGHSDAGHTSCPGHNLYELLPVIRNRVRKNMVSTRLVNKNQKVIRLPDFFYSADRELKIAADIGINTVKSCTTTDKTVDIKSCEYDGEQVVIILDKKDGFSSGIKTIRVVSENGTKKEVIALSLFQKDLDQIISNIKKSGKKKYNIKDATESSKKITHRITTHQAKQFMQQKINVLLHELSKEYTNWNVKCEDTCTFVVDGDVYQDKVGLINVHDDVLYLTLGEDIYMPETLYVTTEDHTPIEVMNYKRESYKKVPRNTFRGILRFTKDTLPNSDKEQFVVINTLDFDDYLKGVAETNDTEHIEKNKVMALAAKNYALFYMHPDNIHPSISAGATYNAIDDPDLFQKYVGAGLEKTLTKWTEALEETKDKIVTYNGAIAILPYFSCSAGFTLTAKEKRGWTDTPYLQSRLDIERCSKFDGHGVGMSGRGAEWRANKGWKYEDILNYYYEGVDMTDIQ